MCKHTHSKHTCSFGKAFIKGELSCREWPFRDVKMSLNLK